MAGRDAKLNEILLNTTSACIGAALSHLELRGQKFNTDTGFPRPQAGARIPISWKRGFWGPNTPISPRPEKGSFLSKNPLFSSSIFDRKLPFPACVRAKGKGCFWTPKPSFPAPVWGRGNPKHRLSVLKLFGRPKVGLFV